jgi:hypothetical protein
MIVCMVVLYVLFRAIYVMMFDDGTLVRDPRGAWTETKDTINPKRPNDGIGHGTLGSEMRIVLSSSMNSMRLLADATPSGDMLQMIAILCHLNCFDTSYQSYSFFFAFSSFKSSSLFSSSSSE